MLLPVSQFETKDGKYLRWELFIFITQWDSVRTFTLGLFRSVGLSWLRSALLLSQGRK